jgi:hypothetical protein
MDLRLFSANEEITKHPRRPVDRPTGVNDPKLREWLSGQLHYPITDVFYEEHTGIATLASEDKTHTHIRWKMGIITLTRFNKIVALSTS